MRNRIKEYREKLGWSLEKLARMANLSRTCVVNAENGTNCTVSTAMKICKALGADFNTVFLP